MSTFTPKYPNSAGRLLAILESLTPSQSYVSQLGPILFNEKVTQDIGQKTILGVRCLTQLHNIYAEFIEDLSGSTIGEDERNVYLKGLGSLSSLIFPPNIDQGVRKVNGAEIALLEVCATRLPRENIIESDDIELIKQSIEELRSAINELPQGSILRTILLELARLSEDSINRFNIYGAKGLKKTFKSMLAEIAEVQIQDEIEVSEVRDTTAWEKSVELIKKFDVVASKAMKYKPVLEKASNYLLGS